MMLLRSDSFFLFFFVVFFLVFFFFFFFFFFSFQSVTHEFQTLFRIPIRECCLVTACTSSFRSGELSSSVPAEGSRVCSAWRIELASPVSAEDRRIFGLHGESSCPVLFLQRDLKLGLHGESGCSVLSCPVMPEGCRAWSAWRIELFCPVSAEDRKTSSANESSCPVHFLPRAVELVLQWGQSPLASESFSAWCS